MIATTIQHKAGIESLAIAGTIAICCVAYALTQLARRKPLIPRALVWTPPAVDLPPVGGPISRRGTAGCETAAALALRMVGDEFEAVEFEWVCR